VLFGVYVFEKNLYSTLLDLEMILYNFICLEQRVKTTNCKIASGFVSSIVKYPEDFIFCLNVPIAINSIVL
jgi:hypothetical protein